MKKPILIILILIVFIAGCARIARVRRIKPEKAILREISKPVSSLAVGERATFTGAWKGIPIGTATATVEELTTYKGYEVYKVVVVAKTSEFLSKLFKVEDTFISYIDKYKFISRRYEAIRREGNYKKDLIVDYDFGKLTASYTNLRDGTVKTCPIEKNVQDPVSAAYYCRTIPVNAGDEVRITVNLNEENYEIIAEIKKIRSVTLPELGTFNAVLVEPYIKLKGKRQRRAKTWGYISTGGKRMPLYGVVRILEIPWIGEITATLKRVEYLGEDVPKTGTLRRIQNQ